MRIHGRQPSTLLIRAACVLWLVLPAAAICLALAFSHDRRGYHSDRTRCSSNLRQLGLAAIQFTDDKRMSPQALGAKGIQTHTTTRVARTLLWYGYHDNPEAWICPESDDAYVPIDDDCTAPA